MVLGRDLLRDLYEIERAAIFLFLLSLSLTMTRKWNGLAKAAVLWTGTEAGIMVAELFGATGVTLDLLLLMTVFSSSVFLWEILQFLAVFLTSRCIQSNRPSLGGAHGESHN